MTSAIKSIAQCPGAANEKVYNIRAYDITIQT